MAKTTKPPNPAATPPRHVLPPLFAEPDLVDRIFELFVEHFPELQSHRISQLKDAAREEFKGEECYIPVRSPTSRQMMVAEVLRTFNGRNATELARRLQVSRATVYRWIKQPGARTP